MSRSKSLIGVGIASLFAVAASAQPTDPPPASPPSETAPPAASPTPAAPPAVPDSPPQASPAPATAVVRGTVRSQAGEPIAGALVSIGGGAAAALADGDGKFELVAPTGTSAVEIEAVGYATWRTGVAVGDGLAIDARMIESQSPGEEIVISGSRAPEKRLDAPVTLEIVTERDLRTAAGTGYLSSLSRVKGVDFSDVGINDQRISARGFATQFNSRMLAMVDGRLAQLPGAGLPQSALMPVGGLDMKAVEVVIGPASALYGANAHTGVINVLTKTPWDDSGATLSLKGGGQSMVAGAARIAGTVDGRFGWKLNGEYLRADDFEPDRAAGSHDYGTTLYEGDLLPDYAIRSTKLDGTAYYRQAGWLASVGAGFSTTDGMSMTNAGRNHLLGYEVQTQTAQISGPHVYAQATRTASSAGKTYQMERLVRTAAAMPAVLADPAALEMLRDSIAIIDSSSMIDSELQGRYTFSGVKTTVGGQLRRYMPSSAGTYLDDKTSELRVTEAGAYVQLDTTVLDHLRLAGAARIDTHSLYSAQFSPKLAVQYELAPSHNVRVGYNRAFKSPTILENYLRISEVLLGNRTGFIIRDAAGTVISEIKPLRPEQVDAIELGYKGAVGDEVYIDVVAYQSWYRDFISALTGVASPAGPTPTFASYPDGTPTAQGMPTEGTLQTYLNFGRALIRGADIGVDYRPIPKVTLSGSASLLKLVSFENDNALQKDLVLNAPSFKLRGSAQVNDLPVDSAFARVDARYRNRHPFESGYWNSTSLLGRDLAARVVVDLTLGYKLPNANVTIMGTVSNLFDDRVPDVLGAPIKGRFAWLGVVYDYDGLKL
jgi:outer membrane receptor for ferrienterochelin and colicins